MNVKTIDPELVYLHIDNCVDLQKIYSDFNLILDEYPNETVVSNTFEYCKQKCDSIYNEIAFFISMERGNLPVKDSYDGSVSKFKNEFPVIGRLYSELTDGEFLVLNEIGDPQFRNNNTEVLVQVSRFQDNKVLVERQYWKKINFEYQDVAGLIQQGGMYTLSTWFIMFWLEKFRTATDLIRNRVTEALTDSEFYRPFSESIGCLKNVEFNKQCNTTSMTETSIPAGKVPYTYPGVVNYIATDKEKKVTLEISKKVHELFRSNIKNITGDYEKGGTTSNYPASHGADLRTDVDHVTRMSSVVPRIHTTLQQELRKMYDVLMFISNNSNAMKSPKIIYKKSVENNMIDVDMLKSKVKKITTAYESNKLLGV